MPKSSTKNKTKTQLKAKRATQPETPGITTKKSYWIMLTVFIGILFSVACYLMTFPVEIIVVLTFSMMFLISLIGYVRLTPSNLSKSKRGTFLFVGASVIGFGIWAIIITILIYTTGLATAFVNQLFILTSLIICLTLGAFIGELMGKISRIQNFFFKPKNDL